ncbi:MBL fold metallo-hydrolase [Patescibacteria group bacterium]
MDIIWHGNSCFTLRNKTKTIVIDPHKGVKELQGDIILTSLGKNTEKIADVERIFDCPGEYEVKGVPIIGMHAKTKVQPKKEKKEDDEDDSEEKIVEEVGENTIIFHLQFDKIKICHLAELGQSLTSEMVNQIGDVDILMIDASEEGNLDNKRAMEIVEAIDPRIVIPMGEGSFDSFVKELGVSEVNGEKKFVVKSSSQLPDENRETVILEKV